jgi:hypothetical protein
VVNSKGGIELRMLPALCVPSSACGAVYYGDFTAVGSSK